MLGVPMKTMPVGLQCRVMRETKRCPSGLEKCSITSSIHSLPYQSKYSQAAHIKCYDQHKLVALMGNYFGRTLAFSMNDELVHTGNPKLAWYYFVIGVLPHAVGG